MNPTGRPLPLLARSTTARDPRTTRIITAALEVHRQLGPGLPESVYEECLCHELHLRNIPFARQLQLPIS